MKYNYLVSSYNNTMMKYKKYFSRLQRDINNGSFVKLSAARKNFLVRKVDELRAKLASMQPKLAGVIAGAGLLLALNAPQVQAQYVLNSTKNPFGGKANLDLVPFNSPNGSASSPFFVDLDGDGKKDAIVGDGYNVDYFKNTGTISAPVFTAQTGTNNPFPQLITYSTQHRTNMISMGDLDNDGDFDMVISLHDHTEQTYYFENTGTSSAPSFVQQTGTDNPISVITSNTGTHDIYNALVDIDHDGDLDIFVGHNDFYSYSTYSNDGVNTTFFKNTGTASAPAFVEQPATANPLAIGIGYSNSTVSLSFVDIDGDGDYDALVANDNGSSLSYYKNTGTNSAAVFALQTGTNSPISQFNESISYLNSRFTDLDGDGDQDLIIGGKDGVYYYKNTGTPTAAVFDFTPGLNLGNNNKPAFVDIDGDGDKDAVFGSVNTLHNVGLTYYKNIGTTSAPVYVDTTGTNNPFAITTSFDYNQAPAFTDMDGDGDLDLILGSQDGTFTYFKNNGTTTAPVFNYTSGGGIGNNPLDGEDVGNMSTPAFVDLDNDGDKDMLSGSQNSGLFYYMNTGTATAPVYTLQTATDGPFATLSASYFSVPTFLDVDGDGDQDLIISSYNGMAYYKNTGTASAAVFAEQTGTDNPFAIASSNKSAPAFMDIDNDGDMDLFVGNYNGTVRLYENTTPIPVIVVPTSILSASFSSTLSAYPNPVKDVLNFSVNDAIGSNMKVSVLDMSGSELMAQSFENSGATMNINVSGLNAGIYVLKLSSDAKAGVVKFVKQ
jgi:hypothetical protein